MIIHHLFAGEVSGKVRNSRYPKADPNMTAITVNQTKVYTKCVTKKRKPTHLRSPVMRGRGVDAFYVCAGAAHARA